MLRKKTVKKYKSHWNKNPTRRERGELGRASQTEMQFEDYNFSCSKMISYHIARSDDSPRENLLSICRNLQCAKTYVACLLPNIRMLADFRYG